MSETDLVVAAGGSWSGIVPRGSRLRITDLEGRQAVDFLCYAAADPQERYHAANTLKRAATLRLGPGHVLYSDVARPLMTILFDSSGSIDTIGGCCSAPSNEMLYGVAGRPGCRENFLAELARWGLGRKDVVANLNFFSAIPVAADGSLDPLTFAPAMSRAGDHVVLRAEQDVLAVISNCPQVSNPCNGGAPTPIRVEILTGPE